MMMTLIKWKDSGETGSPKNSINLKQLADQLQEVGEHSLFKWKKLTEEEFAGLMFLPAEDMEQGNAGEWQSADCCFPDIFYISQQFSLQNILTVLNMSDIIMSNIRPSIIIIK